MATPWIAVSVGAALLLMLIFVLAYKKRGFLKPWTHEQWIEGGAIFLLIAYIMCWYGRDSEVLAFIGILYITVGFIRKYLLKGKKYTEKQRNYITAGIALFVLAVLIAFMLLN